jgi:thiamine kinase-like enzyme
MMPGPAVLFAIGLAAADPDACPALAGFDAAHHPRVTAALEATFGADWCATEVEVLHGGMSGTGVYGVTHGDRVRVMKIHPEAALPTVAGAVQACTLAADLGLAPLLSYVSPRHDIVVEERVEGATLQPGALDPDSLRRLGAVLGTLHAAEGPYPSGPDPFADIRAQLEGARAANACLPASLDIAMERLDRIEAACRAAGVPPSPIHNDLNPRNVMVRPDGSFVLVDWSDARLGDPFFDLGHISCLQCLDARQETALLDAWGANTRAGRAHLYLMTQVVLLDAATKLLRSSGEVAGRAEPPSHAVLEVVERRLETEDFDPFCVNAQAFATRTLDMGTEEALLQIGLSALHEFLENTGSARFSNALAALATTRPLRADPSTAMEKPAED